MFGLGDKSPSTVRVRALRHCVRVIDDSSPPISIDKGAIVPWPADDTEKAIRNGLVELIELPAPSVAAK